MKYCNQHSPRRTGRAYTVPTILLVETSSRNDEGECLEFTLLLLHGESEDSGFIIQTHDEGWIITLGRQDLYVKLEVGFSLGTDCELSEHVADLHLAVMLGHSVETVGDIDDGAFASTSVLWVGTNDL